MTKPVSEQGLDNLIEAAFLTMRLGGKEPIKEAIRAYYKSLVPPTIPKSNYDFGIFKDEKKRLTKEYAEERRWGHNQAVQKMLKRIEES